MLFIQASHYSKGKHAHIAVKKRLLACALILHSI